MGGACSADGGSERCVQNFGGKHEGKRQLGTLRRRWEDNIKADLLEVWVWTGLSWLRIDTNGGYL
jgi:hypothetical protein